MPTAKELYLDLLKKSVLEELYTENEVRLQFLRACLEGREKFDETVFLDIRRRWKAAFDECVRLNQFGMAYGRRKEDIGFQHTMISRARLESLEACLEAILHDQIPGDCIECGVWRGGAVIFMRGFLAAHQVTNRTVWVADSFQGLPVPTLKEDEDYDLSVRTYPMLAIDEETVKDTFARYGLLDDQVRFLKGWFKDTLSAAPIKQLSLLRADGDLYESTMDILRALYHKVALGGFVIIDDYGALPPCRQAVTDFRAEHSITEPLQQADWTAFYWRRER
jgi:O-methyltransferase